MVRRSRSGILPSLAYYRPFRRITTEEIENSREAHRGRARRRRGICEMGDLSGFGGSPELVIGLSCALAAANGLIFSLQSWVSNNEAPLPKSVFTGAEKPEAQSSGPKPNPSKFPARVG